MADLLERLKNEGFDNYVHITLSYIFKEGDVKDEEGFRKVIRSELSRGCHDISREVPTKGKVRG
jgi:hypothetical protein